MQSIEFQSVIEGDAIRIPEHFMKYITETEVVKVTIIPIYNDKIKVASKADAGTLKPNSFSALKINTNGWKFNRDEANERR